MHIFLLQVFICTLKMAFDFMRKISRFNLLEHMFTIKLALIYIEDTFRLQEYMLM